MKKLVVLFLLASYLLVQMPALPGFVPDFVRGWQKTAKQEFTKGIAVAQRLLERISEETRRNQK